MMTATTTFATLAAQLAGTDSRGPAAVWRHFETLCTTPRMSKQEDALRDKLQLWAQSRGLACVVDDAGNLIIRKPASAGCEHLPGVILQGHIDMVCQVNQGVQHDFSADPLKPILRDGWLVAEQTTLGADNGIGVALALAALEMNDAKHGPLEVLLTVDEEAGMGGAQGLQAGTLHGSLLLNLDTEEWGEFYIGCAGGLDVDVKKVLRREAIPTAHSSLRIVIDGLCGGHSGCDVHLGRGNANKLLVRAVRELGRSIPLRLSAVDGGTARNAIPREAWADIACPAVQQTELEKLVATLDACFRAELAGVDDGVRLRLASTSALADVIHQADQDAVLAALHAAPIGVRRMSASVQGVVETSNNLGTMRIDANGLEANLMVRSLVDSAAAALGDEIASLFTLAGCEVEVSGHYPGWRPNAESALLAKCRAVYDQVFGAEYGPSRVQVIHAGLECGIIGGTHPQLDMVSFGPTIRGAHAPGERVDVASVNRCWHLLAAILASLAKHD
jgi:dipeptidase D